MTESSNKRNVRRTRWSYVENGDAGEIQFTPEFVDQLASAPGRGTKQSLEAIELSERLAKMRDRAEPGDYMVIELDTVDATSEADINNLVINMRTKVGQYIKEQEWPYKTSVTGRRSNRRAYDTIAYVHNNRAFLIVRKLASIVPDEKSE